MTDYSALAKEVGGGRDYASLAAKFGGKEEIETEDPGAVMAGVIAAGRVYDQLLKGGKHAALGVAEKFGATGARDELARMGVEEAENRAIYERLQSKRPVATFMGEVGALLPLGAAGGGYRAAMAAGALPGVLSYGDVGERAIAGVAGGAGGAAGQALGNLVGRVFGRGAERVVPQQLNSAQQRAIVREAQALGYELQPSQVSGKEWQRNLEAVFAKMPSTSTRAQEMGQRNVERTRALVSDVVERMGGEVDQPAAQAAAMEGWQQAMEAERGRVGQGYRDLLRGREVDLEAARPELQRLLAEQEKLPRSAQATKGVEALRELLGTPGYTKTARKGPTLAPLSVQDDDIVTAVRKLGGINPEDDAVGSLAKSIAFSPDPRYGPVWRAPTFRGSTSTGQGASTGRWLNDMAEKLYERGYLSGPGETDELMQKLMDSSTGVGRHFSAHREGTGQVDPLASAIEGLTKKLGEKTAPPAAKAGYIREHPELEGNLTQKIRSVYSLMSEEAKGADRELYGAMKGAIDFALEKSLPKEAQGQFAALNKQYGRFAVLEAMSPKQQAAFLSNLYRGGKNPDVFYTFLGMAPEGEFKDVARGFISNLLEKAKGKGGEVEAAKLGRAVRATDPQALRFLGGEAGEDLARIGRVGENVLAEQVANSGTAQRALFQGLLQGGGALGGAGLGAQEGGFTGGLLGSGVGAFLLPRAAQGVYLSDLVRGLMARQGRAYPGVPGVRDVLTPEVQDWVAKLASGAGIGAGVGATQ